MKSLGCLVTRLRVRLRHNTGLSHCLVRSLVRLASLTGNDAEQDVTDTSVYETVCSLPGNVRHWRNLGDCRWRKMWRCLQHETHSPVQINGIVGRLRETDITGLSRGWNRWVWFQRSSAWNTYSGLSIDAIVVVVWRREAQNYARLSSWNRRSQVCQSVKQQAMNEMERDTVIMHRIVTDQTVGLSPSLAFWGNQWDCWRKALLHVPASSPSRGGDVAVYVKPTELAHYF